MRHLFILLCTTLAFAGCTGSGGNGHTPQDSDTLYTEPKAMSIHFNNPERALVMIDSAVIVGNISWERGEYLKAVTQFGGLHNYALSRQTCLDLIKSDPTDSVTLESVYSLLTTIEYTLGNYPAVIRYATEASRLAHALDKPVEVGKMEGKIAYALAETGKTDEGIDRLRATIDELRLIHTFNGINAYHSTSNALLHILLNHERYEEMVTVCEDMLQRLDEFAQHPEKFGDMRKDFDPAEFIDFARGQTLVFLTTAYARQYTAADKGEVMPAVRAELLRKAREAESELFKTKWGHTPDCDRMMTAAYHHLGEFQRFDEAMARLDAEEGDDTINTNYLTRLSLLSTAAQMRGRMGEAVDYLTRRIVIQDSLYCRNQRDQLNELATVYHLQEEQFARQKAENDAHLMKLYVLFTAAALLVSIAFAAYFFYKRRETAMKNHVLAREIAERLKIEDEKNKNENSSVAEGTADNPQSSMLNLQSAASDKDLYLLLRKAIMRDQLFLDPQLDRQQLVDRFGLSKERIGAAFAKGSPYKSLIDFLTDCRLPHAAKLLTERPDLSIADVARKSGFPTLNTFGRNFKQKYALTPSQFREQQVS